MKWDLEKLEFLSDSKPESPRPVASIAFLPFIMTFTKGKEPFRLPDL